jgi:hypothetical protein
MMSDITPTGDMMSYRELAAEYGRVLDQRDELVEALEKIASEAVHRQDPQWCEDVALAALAQSDEMSDYDYGEELEESLKREQRLEAEVKRLRSLVADNAKNLTTIMRMPNIEHVADEHNAAVLRLKNEALQEAVNGTSKTTGNA